MLNAELYLFLPIDNKGPRLSVHGPYVLCLEFCAWSCEHFARILAAANGLSVLLAVSWLHCRWLFHCSYLCHQPNRSAVLFHLSLDQSIERECLLEEGMPDLKATAQRGHCSEFPVIWNSLYVWFLLKKVERKFCENGSSCSFWNCYDWEWLWRMFFECQ